MVSNIKLPRVRKPLHPTGTTKCLFWRVGISYRAFSSSHRISDLGGYAWQKSKELHVSVWDKNTILSKDTLLGEGDYSFTNSQYNKEKVRDLPRRQLRFSWYYFRRRYGCSCHQAGECTCASQAFACASFSYIILADLIPYFFSKPQRFHADSVIGNSRARSHKKGKYLDVIGTHLLLCCLLSYLNYRLVVMEAVDLPSADSNGIPYPPTNLSRR